MDIFDLHEDVILHMAKFLEHEERCMLSMTCGYLHSLLKIYINSKMSRSYFCRSIPLYNIMMGLDPVPHELDFYRAIEHGTLEMVIKLDDDIFPLSNIYARCSLHGRLDVIKWFYEDTGVLPCKSILGHQISRNNIEFVQWAMSVGIELGSSHIDIAMTKGHLDILKIAHDKGILMHVNLYVDAIMAGHTHILKWIDSLAPSTISQDELLKLGTNADGTPYTGPVFWCFGKYHRLDYIYFRCPLSNGYFEVLDYLLTKGRPNKGALYEYAAMYENTDSLEWLSRNSFDLDDFGRSTFPATDAFTYAISRNRICNMEWLRIHGFPIIENALEMAVRLGNLESAKWIRANNYDWYPNICTDAMYYYSADILEWTIGEGAPFNIEFLIHEIRRMYNDMECDRDNEENDDDDYIHWEDPNAGDNPEKIKRMRKFLESL